MSTIVEIPLTLSNDDTVELLATATAGTYTAMITIKGLPYIEQVTITNSPDIISIANVFQANTLHALRIYDSAGELLDNTEYYIQTNTVQKTGVKTIHSIKFTSTGGETELTNPVFINASDIMVFMEGGLSYSVEKTADNTIEYPFPLSDKQTITIKVLK